MKKLLGILLVTGMLAAMMAGCGLGVPSPEIESGEFNFSVTYEYCGETRTVSGVYACEYDGTSWTLDGGSHRSWAGYFKDDALENTIAIGTAPDGRTVDLNFGLYPDYFMGDDGGIENCPEPWLSVTVRDDEGLYFENDADVILETYNAKIISYAYDIPVANTFH